MQTNQPSKHTHIRSRLPLLQQHYCAHCEHYCHAFYRTKSSNATSAPKNVAFKNIHKKLSQIEIHSREEQRQDNFDTHKQDILCTVSYDITRTCCHAAIEVVCLRHAKHACSRHPQKRDGNTNSQRTIPQ